MKRINLILIVIGVIYSAIIYNASSQNQENFIKSIKNSGIEVYYFHYTHRCATCIAVENESKKAIEILYPDKATFQAFNLEEDEGKNMAAKLDIDGQTLIIVTGNNKIDITNEGFLYARSNPEKLKQIIKEKIDPLL